MIDNKMQTTIRQPLKIIRLHHIFNLQYDLQYGLQYHPHRQAALVDRLRCFSLFRLLFPLLIIGVIMAVNMWSNLVNVMVMDVKVKVMVIDLIVRIMTIDVMVRGSWGKWFWRQRHVRIES